jgi:hypothetical protein
LRKGTHSNPSLSFIILTVLSSASYFDNIILIVLCQQHFVLKVSVNSMLFLAVCFTACYGIW